MSETPTLDQLRATLSHIASAYWMAANWRDGDARQRMEHVQWLEEALPSLLADRDGIDLLDEAGVASIHFHDRSQFLPGRQSLRAALISYTRAKASLGNPISIDASRSGDTK